MTEDSLYKMTRIFINNNYNLLNYATVKIFVGGLLGARILHDFHTRPKIFRMFMKRSNQKKKNIKYCTRIYAYLMRTSTRMSKNNLNTKTYLEQCLELRSCAFSPCVCWTTKLGWAAACGTFTLQCVFFFNSRLPVVNLFDAIWRSCHNNHHIGPSLFCTVLPTFISIVRR